VYLHQHVGVANNDSSASIGDVIDILYSLPESGVIGGRKAGDLHLRQARNRLSMSIVYDCLWVWGTHFRAGEASGRNGGGDGFEGAEDEFLSPLSPVHPDILHCFTTEDFLCCFRNTPARVLSLSSRCHSASIMRSGAL
jgi:hypothetical protein